MKLFFRKNRGVWGIVFCVSKTRRYPKYGESGKRFALSFRKKAGGQSENFAALLHKPPSRPPFGCLSRHSLGSGGCRNKTGMDIPLRGCRGRNQPPLQNKRRAERGDAVSPLKKAISPYWEHSAKTKESCISYFLLKRK